MAKKKKRGKAGRGANKKRRTTASSNRRSGGATRSTRPRGNDTDNLKKMGYGMLLILGLCVFFFVRFGDQTLFNHLVQVVSPAEDIVKPADEDSAGKGPKLGSKVKTAAPMERLTTKEQGGLDNLVKTTTK